MNDLRHHATVVSGLLALLRQVCVGSEDLGHALAEQPQHEGVVHNLRSTPPSRHEGGDIVTRASDNH